MRKRKRALLLAGILALALAAGCMGNAGDPPEEPEDFAVEEAPEDPQPEGWELPDLPGLQTPEGKIPFGELPVMDGSTATLPLGRALASHFSGLTEEEAELRVSFSRTEDSYSMLVWGRADILLVYEGSGNAKKQLEAEGQEFEQKIIGYDGLVFLTGSGNPVDSLTTGEIQGIYTGHIANWSGVGGADAPITAYQRNRDSGSHTMMQKLVMDGLTFAEAPTGLSIQGMGQLIEAVSDYRNGDAAIGYSVYYYAANMYSTPEVKLLAVDGVHPTTETIADGTYPLINPFYAIIRKDEPVDSAARALYDFLTTEEGVRLIREAGYVPAG